MKRLTLALAVVVALLASSAATAASSASPAQYRKSLNAICRAYTPKIAAAEDQMGRATKSQRKNVFEAGLRSYLSLQLKQSRQIERVRVPGLLARSMKPALKTLHKLDPHYTSALAHARSGDIKATRSQMSTIIRISEPLNGQLDAAGLIDCGSNQP
jgi:hypothetical protein